MMVGDKSWEVEWITELVYNDAGEIEHDETVFAYEKFDSEELAIEFAKIASLTNECWITEYELAPYDDDGEDIFWDCVSEPVHYRDGKIAD